MSDRPGYFIDVDADNEPTLWVTHVDRPDYPLPLIRRCDIPPNGRAYVWSVLEDAHHQDEPKTPTYGWCTACGSVEVALVKVTGHRDLSHMGEHPRYPTGYGCEVCA